MLKKFPSCTLNFRDSSYMQFIDILSPFLINSKEVIIDFNIINLYLQEIYMEQKGGFISSTAAGRWEVVCLGSTPSKGSGRT